MHWEALNQFKNKKIAVCVLNMNEPIIGTIERCQAYWIALKTNISDNYIIDNDKIISFYEVKD